MKAKELKPGDKFVVALSLGRHRVRVCVTNDPINGLLFAYPNNHKHCYPMDGEVNVKLELEAE